MSAPPPDTVCTLAAVISCGAQDVAVLLMRLGHERAVMVRKTAAWFAQQRRGASDCAAEDVEPPPDLACWADHDAFRRPWLEDSSWADLETTAAGRGMP